MKKSLIICLLLMTILMFSSCRSESNIENESDNFIKYDQFIFMFDTINQDMKLSGYENLGGNEGVELVFIDERISFGKRNYLTIDNELNSSSTQQRIEYMSEDEKSLAIIDLIYLDKLLNNDLIYWSNPLSGNSENEFIRKTFTENIISYKNILIKISLFAIDSNEINPSMLTGISTEVVDYIQSIEL